MPICHATALELHSKRKQADNERAHKQMKYVLPFLTELLHVLFYFEKAVIFPFILVLPAKRASQAGCYVGLLTVPTASFSVL